MARTAITAITGDIGSGKTTAAHIWAALHDCESLDADKVAKSMWDCPAVKAIALSRWGQEILGSDGKIIPSRIAEHIFSQASEHDFCNSLIHPRVMSYLRERAAEFNKSY